MAELPSLFDATEEIADPFAPLPAAWYTATINESAVSPNKKNNGHYLKLVFVINGGESNGKKVTEYLNIKHNESETAEAIAKRSLQEICNALGLKGIEDSIELHGQPMKIKLKINEANAQYGPSNSIVAYAGMDDDIPEEGEEGNPF